MRPYTLTHQTHTSGQTSRHYNRKPRNTLLILDARIHYPVLKHPTKPHTHPDTTPNPTPTRPPKQPGRQSRTSGMPAGADPHTEETTNPHPTHRAGPTPHHTGRRREKRGSGLFPQDPTVRHPPHPPPSPAPAYNRNHEKDQGVRTSTMFPPMSTPGGTHGRPGCLTPRHQPTTGRRGVGSSLERR